MDSDVLTEQEARIIAKYRRVIEAAMARLAAQG
jgi:hypothetical protein